MVEGEGFEPSKAEPADLQSAPVGHLGTPPTKPHILAISVPKCQIAHCFCTVSYDSRVTSPSSRSCVASRVFGAPCSQAIEAKPQPNFRPPRERYGFPRDSGPKPAQGDHFQPAR